MSAAAVFPPAVLQPDPCAPRTLLLLGAYTRDPARLFSQFTVLPPAANSTSSTEWRPLRFAQPVCFRNVVLACTVAHLPAGTAAAAASVNFLSGRVQLYAHETDMCQSAGAAADALVHPRLPTLRDSYLGELLALLHRGHSLMHPQCRCRHAFCAQRARELGIDSSDSDARDGCCPLGEQQALWTSAQLAAEIGVGSIYAVRTPYKCLTLADALVEQAGVFVTTSHPYLWHQFGLRSGVEAIADKQQLLAHIDARAMGGVCSHGRAVYAGFDADLEALGKEGFVYTVYNRDIAKWVGFPRHHRLEMPRGVDDDVRALWQSAARSIPSAGVTTHGDMDRLLAAAGVPATRVQPRAASVTAAPAPRAAKRPRRRGGNL